MSRKLLILLSAASIVVLAGVATASIVSYNSCGYDEQTGNYLYDGNKVAAHGTMDAAMECALQGMLPDIVIDRLGMYCDEEAQREGTRIYYTDTQKKEELESKKK